MIRRSINEAYKSQKLKNIIDLHGKPRKSDDYIFLYDLTDDNIIAVADNEMDVYKAASEENAPYITTIKLNDGSYLGINTPITKINNEIKDRHIGGITDKSGNYIHKSHNDNNKYYKPFYKYNKRNYGMDTISDDFELKKHLLRIKKLKQLLTDDDYKTIADYINDHLNFNYDSIDFENEYTQYVEIDDDDIELSFGPCLIATKYAIDLGEPWRAYGEYFCDATIGLEELSLYVDDYFLGLSKEEGYADDIITDVELDFDYKKLGINIEYRDKRLEAGVYDYGEMYGVSNRDFI